MIPRALYSGRDTLKRSAATSPGWRTRREARWHSFPPMLEPGPVEGQDELDCPEDRIPQGLFGHVSAVKAKDFEREKENVGKEPKEN